MTTVWTPTVKPSNTKPLKGQPLAPGFFLYITYPTGTNTPWTNIAKASGTSWTPITKPSNTIWTPITKAT